MRFVSVRNAVSPLNVVAVTSCCVAAARREWNDRSARESARVKVAATRVDLRMRTGRYLVLCFSSIDVQ
jgi:hypothetical protein